MGRKLPGYKKFLLGLFGVGLIVAADGILGIFLPDASLTMLESVYRLCREDPVVLWSQRPRITMLFQNAPVQTDGRGLRRAPHGDRAGRRVLCLGASSTFGWGVRADEAYPVQLQTLLNREGCGTWQVINAGQIGYSSLQGLRFLERSIAAFSPEIVTVPFILNDIDRCRFFRNAPVRDAELVPEPALYRALKNMSGQSRIFLLARRAAAWWYDQHPARKARILKKHCQRAGARVTPDEYAQNLAAIAQLGRAYKCRVIFLKMPVHLSLPEHAAAEGAAAGQGTLSEEFFARGQAAEQARDYEQACAWYEQSLAHQVLDVAADAAVYQQRMEAVARQQGIELVDIAAVYAACPDRERLFNGAQDPIHPSPQGHRRIAEALREAVCRRP